MTSTLTRLRRTVGAFIGVAVIAGCSALAPSTPPATPPAIPPATGEHRLAGVCPDPIVVQSHWEPGVENGATYQLLGPGYTIDAARKRVSGPLVTDGRDTGVRIEIHSGGAANGFTPVPAQMYLDRSILLGSARTDTVISTSGKFPITSVVALLNKSPQVLMWDPASHPDWHTIADIGATNTPVSLTKDSNFGPFLVAKGLIKESQIDRSYTGSPSRFLANPTISQQAYATSEPYIYEKELPAWGKPVAYQLLTDVGYAIYPDTLAVRANDVDSQAPCLRRLVPILQQAQLDFLRNPDPIKQLIVAVVEEYNDGWTYSIGLATYSVDAMKRLHIVGNDTSGPLGGMDPTRVQSTVDDFAPILRKAGAPVKPGLAAADIATNRFLNPTIRLP